MAKEPTAVELAEKYQSLSDFEKNILKVLALFLAPIGRTPLVNALKSLNIRVVPTHQLSLQDISPFITELQKKNILPEEPCGIFCYQSMREMLMKSMENSGELPSFLEAVTPIISKCNVYGDSLYYSSYKHLLQHIRLTIYQRNLENLTYIMRHSYRYHSNDLDSEPPFTVIFPEPLDTDFFLSLPSEIFTLIIQDLCNSNIKEMKPSKSFDLLEKFVTSGSNIPLETFHFYLYFLLFRGRLRNVEENLATLGETIFSDLRGMLAFFKGDDDAAIACFDKEISYIKKTTGKRKVFIGGYIGLFHLLALIRSGMPHHLANAVELSTLAMQKEGSYNRSINWLLNQLSIYKTGVTRNLKELEQELNRDYNLSPLIQIIQSFVALSIKKVNPKVHLRKLSEIQKKAENSGYLWFAAEAVKLRQMIAPDEKHKSNNLEKLYTEEGLAPLIGSEDSSKTWERSLRVLLSIGETAQSGKTATAGASRLLWQISGDNLKQAISIQPIEQKQKGSSWSNGRNIALKRLIDPKSNIDFMTPQDRKIASYIKKDYSYYYGNDYIIDTDKALSAMIGHPLVFNAKTSEQITVARGTFTLKVDRSDKTLKLTLSPEIIGDQTFFAQWEASTKLVVYEINREQQQIAAILGSGLSVPLDGEQKISAAITAIAPFVTVHSDVATENSSAETVDPDKKLQIILMPFEAGIKLELQVRPLGEKASSFYPGRGGATVIAAIDGKSLQTTRDVKEEKILLQQFLSTSATLDNYPPDDDGCWRIGNPEGSLELLQDLQKLTVTNPEQFIIKWPEGEKLKLRGSASSSSMTAKVSSGKDWFSIEGNVTVSENEVLTLQQVLELTALGKGRFVQLADGEFIALTEEFRRRLDELRFMMEKHGKENRFHPLAASLVEDALHGIGGVSGDKLWKTTLQRFKKAEALQPLLPKTFQATLRDYQQEGFEWLSRLAQWGVGACLADDMGLGKTIQALALLVDRAPKGASFVLAPTSVCLNWESECRRFAPTLNPRIFGSGNRQEFVESLQPFDLAICSYTMFQQEADLLTSVEWNTVILDEAQAIKNMATKRSQAAMLIKADFRIATTGTPVENRLDELWNLFRFLNPGLLGSQKNFSIRFGTPIERDSDKNARTLLKKLIRPFMLRRTKSQVLQELPPRTDILQRVELSKEEMALYEALRRQAVESLQGGDGQGEGERQIRILAEIMRLRRACCNPKLIMQDSNIGSSKLTAFREIVDELRENGHRALVFSQFVGHLSLVRASLDADGIAYQYLDGSTPQKARQEQVAAFQKGEGDLFLISLKAGGVGLNLTAADYVIHLDPWWNPAVEDQASDRAHRIGQLRPVTVYRLVAANTIEEKIVSLHHQKRDLADSLLEGSDTAARVSADDLMDLLREVG